MKTKAKSTKVTKATDAAILGEERELKKTVVQRELKRIISTDKVLTPERVLEVASERDNPLHRFFQWDNGKAAQAYRLDQARNLIRIVHVLRVIDDGRKQQPVTVRAIVNVNPGKGFVTRNEAIGSETIRAAMVERHLRGLENWVRETSDIVELGPLRDVIANNLERYQREAKRTA
jgi:hypothetical protein